MLRGEELLGQNRRPAPNRVEDPLADTNAGRVLAEDAHQRLQRKLRRQLGMGARAVAELRRPELMRVLELQLIARPHVVEPRCLEALRGLDYLLHGRIARRERTERERVRVEPWH